MKKQIAMFSLVFGVLGFSLKSNANEAMAYGITMGIFSGALTQSSNCTIMAAMGQTCPENRAPATNDPEKILTEGEGKRFKPENDNWQERAFNNGG